MFCPGLAGVGCAIALAGCGGSSSDRASSPYGPASSPFALSKCMRANGVSNFPDPSAGPGGGEGFNGIVASPGSQTLTVDGITFSGPALQTARKACSEYLPPGGPPPQLSAARKAAELAFARCMRTHGVPSFPDPTFTGRPSGASGKQIAISQSPAFNQAAKECGGPKQFQAG
jgi:hypothetical protein